jgi:hypothetical protein
MTLNFILGEKRRCMEVAELNLQLVSLLLTTWTEPHGPDQVRC